MLALVLALALQGPAPPATAPASPSSPRVLPVVDLDGDGRPDPLAFVDGALVAGSDTHRAPHRAARLALPAAPADVDVEVLDIEAADPFRELVVCHRAAPRERRCELHRLRHHALVPLRVDDGPLLGRVSASGTGAVIAIDDDAPLFARLEKYRLVGDRLLRVPQPLLAPPPGAPDLALEPDAPVDLYAAPDDDKPCLRSRPGMALHVVARHGAKPSWALVRLDAGFSAYARLDDLFAATPSLRAAVRPTTSAVSPVPAAR